MVPFLKQVAAHYYQGGSIAKHCFIFPNRRSLVFFKKYLGELVRDSENPTPLLVPPLYTVSDFFSSLTGGGVTDPLRLLLELYQVYQKLNSRAESLDEFVFWGEVMLQDFEDIDTFLVNAEALLQNVQEFKQLGGGMSYLTPGQQEAVENFIRHFRDGKGLLTVQEADDSVKARFLKLWNLLYPIYRDFKAALKEKGMAYEGMLCRELAEKLQAGTPVMDILRAAFPEVEQYVFVGMNALNECEHKLMLRMRDAGVAQYCWDYVSEEIRNPENKSSFYMQRNVEEFPQAFPLEKPDAHKPEIRVVSVPSAVGQAKLAPQILSLCQGDPVETAFVLPDETLLLPLLNAIPPGYDKVNVTMGCPLTGSAVYALLGAAGEMQTAIREKDGKLYIYHRRVRDILFNGIVSALATPEESAAIAKVKADAKYYIPLEDLQGGPLLEAIFRPVLKDPAAVSASQNHAMEEYLAGLAALVGRELSGKGDLLLEVDFAKRYHTQITLLQGIDLEVKPSTHLRILDRLLQGVSVPFRGEPLSGLQVMGPLETRALDFRNLIILSANEGVFPRRASNPSFIPPELRKGFGLPTYEFQDAVWAYYFYRMIQRPEKVWLLYDSRTEGLRSGEESRYIKQLEYLSGIPVHRMVASATLRMVSPPAPIPKTEEDIAFIRGKELSASALQDYLACPVKFYYGTVKGMQEEEEVAESLDGGMLGNVFHRVMLQLYKGRELLTPEDLSALQADKNRLRRLIRQEVLKEMNSIEVTGRNLVLEGILLDYVLNTLRHDAALLSQSGSKGFRILGLERKLKMVFDAFRFKGTLDRIDSYREGVIRVVDYKTGKVSEEELSISDENAAKVAEKLFGPQNEGRPKIALQLLLYDLLAHREFPGGKLYVNSVYSTTHMFSGAAVECPESGQFQQLAAEGLHALLQELVDAGTPWRHTEEVKTTCEWCPFKDICGR